MSVIQVNNLSKKFRIQNGKYTTLKEKLIFWGKSKQEEHWALKNVSLHIHKGETIGLMGRNGSGKSTLLKILSKILFPSSGNMSISGRVSSLLELGAGFHPDFTGLENIYMNASILGLSKREIDSKLKEIIEFSELHEYIDRPVRIYSSGMYMRLAFSIAISVDPDILLIDEVLAVGDTAFQNKCMNKIKELKGQGITIVIVTHDNGVIEKLCDKAVWLHQGELVEIGRPKDVINKYLVALSDMENARLQQEDQASDRQSEIEVPSVSEHQSTENRWGNRHIEITSLRLLDPNGQPRKSFSCGSPLEIEIAYRVNKENEDVVFGIGMFTPDNICCYGTNTYIDKWEMTGLGQEGKVYCRIEKLSLVPGEYLLDVAIHKDNGEPYDYWSRQFRFQVNSDVQDTGIARQFHTWAISAKGG